MYSYFRKSVLQILFLCWCSSVLGLNDHQHTIDSLFNELSIHSAVDQEIDLRIEISSFYLKDEKYDLGFDQLLIASRQAKKMNSPRKLSEVYMAIAHANYDTRNLEEALKNYNQALLIVDGLFPEERVIVYNRMGTCYLSYEENEKALSHFLLALDWVERAKRRTGKEYEWLYNNIAIVYSNLDDYKKAREYHDRCLSVRKKLGNVFGIGQSYNNIGTLFYETKEFDSSLIYFKLGFDYRKMKDDAPISALYESEINIGKALIGQQKYIDGEVLLMRLLNEIQETKLDDLRLRIYEQLKKLYEEKNEFEQAHFYTKSYHALKDSLYGINHLEDIIRINHANKYAEKVLEDSLIAEEKFRIDQLSKEKEDQLTYSILIGLSVGLILLSVLFVIIYKSYRSKKKSSELILEQKQEVERQRDIANGQKDQLEEINKEITDSISYAKRIQQAILPSEKSLSKLLSSYFLFYQPKAIVAGDFYWVYQKGKKQFFAAADCTGHGVPGAFVSIICAGALERAVGEFGLEDPGEILDKTTELVVNDLSKSGKDIHDGMDISLSVIDQETRMLKFSGANNPLYLIRSKSEVNNPLKVDEELENYSLSIIKGTKQPIGYRENRIPFVTHEVALYPNDILYSFSDGFADQFGGPNHKKYKYRAFRLFLLSIADQSIEKQGELLEKEFHRWKGELEQIDDVCVLGVQVS